MSQLPRQGRISPSSFCPQCSLILSRAWEARILIPPGHVLWDTPIDKSIIYPWHTTFAEAQESAMAGCHFCTLICRYCIHQNHVNDQKPLALVFNHTYSLWRNEFARIRNHGHYTLLTLNVRSSREWIWEGNGVSPAYGFHDNTGAIPSGLLTMLRDWSTECKEAHRNCNLPLQDAFPTRLIEIGSIEGRPPKLRLVNANSELRGRYVTLSHCWGPNPDLSRLPRTTVQTLDEYCCDISFGSLPKTFQDATTVTLSLGLKHLWADSLCIIQDDRKDWERESFKMADIYFNSFVTLAATGSCQSFGDEGLFLVRDELEMTSAIWRTPESGKVLALHPFLLRNYFDYDTSPQPLYSRAWCMQELTLSRRVIHFLSGQVILDCSTATSYEFERFNSIAGSSACMLQQFSVASLLSISGGRPLPPTAIFVNAEKQLLPNATSTGVLPHVDTSHGAIGSGGQMTVCFGHPQPGSKLLWNLRCVFNQVRRLAIGSIRSRNQKPIHDEWVSLVENYSVKKIKYSSDRLPAIWSFAKRMQAITQDEYLCGIWRSDIPRALTFKLDTSADEPYDKATAPSPSWSWASQNGNIRYYGDGRLYKTKTKDPLTRPTLLNFTNKALSMGRSERAILTLKCIAAPVIGASDTDSESYDDKLRFGYVEMVLDNTKLVRTLTGKEILCVHMMDFCGLLVTPTEPGSTEYKRVGLAFVRHQNGKGFGEVKHEYLELDWKEMELIIV